MKQCITIFLVLGLFYGIAYSADDTDAVEEFTKSTGLIVRKGLSNKNFAKDPAAIQWTAPNNGKSSTATDIGLAFKLIESETNINNPWILLPKFEFHKNTETEKPQDTIKAGIIFTKLFDAEEKYTHYLETSLEYKNDRKNTGQGVTASIGYTPTYAPLHLGYTGFGPFQYMITPWIAAQVEQADGLKSEDASGVVARIKPCLQLAIYPLHDYVKKNFEILVGDQLWINLSRSGTFKNYSRHQNLFSSSLNLYFDKHQRFGIGVDFTSGENPEEGLARQTTTSLALKGKIGK